MCRMLTLILLVIVTSPTGVVRGAAAAPSADAASIYHDFCSVCHGERGDGVSRASNSLFPSPRNFSSEVSRRELTRARMIFSVTYGRPNTAMAPWKSQLSEVQIAAVVDYVRRTFMNIDDEVQPATASADPVDHGEGVHHHAVPTGDLAAYFAEAYPAQLDANRHNGETLYRQNCVPCHGQDGDGQGPRAYFILPKPRDFKHPAARASLNRPHLFESISKGEVGSEMPAWEKVLSDQQIADISEYVLRSFIRPGELLGTDGGGAKSTQHHDEGEQHRH